MAARNGALGASAVAEPTDTPSQPPLPMPTTLPSGAMLLEQELKARREGSGIVAANLLGTWAFARVWPRGRRQASPQASPQPSALVELVLKGLAASLRIEAHHNGEAAKLWLSNAVRLGPLELRFSGPGWLQGKRPLLLFQFDRLQIRAGRRVLLEKNLPAPDRRRQPFFALIAIEPGRHWLAARGRSGGLAVWRQAEVGAGAQPLDAANQAKES